MRKVYFYLMLLCAMFLASCAAMSGAASLATCQFRINGLSNPTLGGIGINHVININNLDATSLAKLSLGILAGQLPLNTTVNLDVTNPNNTAANLAGLEWQLFYEGGSVLNGFTNSPIYIAPGSRTVIPVVVQVNLIDLFKSNAKNEGFKFANGLLNIGDINSSVSLRVRPSFNIDGRVVKTPYITVNKNF